MTQESLFADAILAPIGEARPGLPHRELTGFMATKGCKYSNELMVVGRAANGWVFGAYPEQFADAAFRRRFARDVRMSVGGDHPMEWVHHQWGAKNCYNTKRSAFWRVIRRVTEGLGIVHDSEGNWPCHLVWSNLYKVSPADGGNPYSSELYNLQFPGCKDLFEAELRAYMPKRLLLLTGWEGWADWFLPDLDEPESSSLYVERVGFLPLSKRYQLRVVVACHPQGRPEEQWSRDVIREISDEPTIAK